MKKSYFNQKLSRSRRRYLLLNFSGVAILIIIWSIVSFSGAIKPLFLPTPTAVINSIITLFLNFNLLIDIWVSFYRVLMGFILSAIISIPLGIYLGISKNATAFFNPIISFIRYIPTSAFIPLLIVWFGIGDLQKVLLIFSGVAPYLTLLVFDVVANTKNEYIEVAYTLGAKQKNIICSIIIPQSLPGIWDSLRLIMGAAWTFVVLAEIVAATSGLGYLIIVSQRFLQTSNVVAIIIIIGILGLFTDLLFRLSYIKLFPWQEKL